MNMQQLMMQAQKMQRELKKAKDAVGEQEFTVSKAGLVTVTMMGDKTLKSIVIEEDGFDKDNKEMVEEMIVSAINEVNQKVDQAIEEVEEKITGRAGGLGF